MGSIAASPSLGLILILSHAHASGFILSSEHTKSCGRSSRALVVWHGPMRGSRCGRGPGLFLTEQGTGHR
jgi:hypothetical protein